MEVSIVEVSHLETEALVWTCCVLHLGHWVPLLADLCYFVFLLCSDSVTCTDSFMTSVIRRAYIILHLINLINFYVVRKC